MNPIRNETGTAAGANAAAGDTDAAERSQSLKILWAMVGAPGVAILLFVAKWMGLIHLSYGRILVIVAASFRRTTAEPSRSPRSSATRMVLQPAVKYRDIANRPDSAPRDNH